MKNFVVIVAAGRGSRASRAGDPPKQYADLGGRTVLAHSIAAFTSHAGIDAVQVVIHRDDVDAYRASVGTADPKLLAPVHGSSTRQSSVRLGLEALAKYSPDCVLIHDAARPFVGDDAIGRVITALGSSPGAIAAIPLADTLKRADAAGLILDTPDRTGLWRAQTPQGFRFAEILAAHRRATSENLEGFTDDAALAAWAGLPVIVVPGGDSNVKLTTAEEIDMARALIGGGERVCVETRVGQGFDVHRFTEGKSVWLCGVEIPHTARLEGHSDADVGLHALTDALLGAIGAGDIGTHFPPSDMQWKDAASHIFLAHAAGLVRAKRGRIVNVDVTILAEAPRVGPHRGSMCQRMAEILQVSPDRVSVKATTTEGLGFTGRREGIAVMAVATIALPFET